MADQRPMTTSISEAYVDRIMVRGQDLCQDLIGKVGFVDYFLLLLTGRKPSEALRAVTEATLVSIAEHGLVPSIQAARMTLAAEPESLQSAVAAGLLGCGSVILGASESAGRVLIDVCATATSAGQGMDAAAVTVMRAIHAKGAKLAGFGHPVHRSGDPRAKRLVAFSKEIGAAGEHVAALEALERNVEAVGGRWLPANVSAAIPAVLLDAGFPAESLKGVPLLARCASLIAHLREESETKLGFRLADRAARDVTYVPGDL